MPTVRILESWDDRRRCVELQRQTWGPDFEERVPAAILMVATRTGGLVAGVDAEDGSLAGFVFGLTGFRDGRPIHWSDMLAVAPAHRGQGLGTDLKRFQRKWLLDRDIRDVYWTFDPLQRRNARLNLQRLGAVGVEFIPDCYGSSSSPLHEGLPTDRLLVHWRLDDPRVEAALTGVPRAAPDGCVWIDPTPEFVTPDPAPPGLIVRIPPDIQELKRSDPDQALRWSAGVRAVLGRCLSAGWRVTGFEQSGREAGHVLTRIPA